jgi:hypothetical protein
MTDPHPSRDYRKNYEDAVKLFDTGDFDECVAAAKHDLA